MALKAKIDEQAHAALPDPIKKEYKAADGGGFVLDVEESDGLVLENVGGLKKALATERSNYQILTKKVKDFGDLDPTTAKEAIRQLEEIKASNPDAKVQEQVRLREEQIVKKWKADLDSKDNELKSTVLELEKMLVTDRALRAISEHKGSVELLLPHVKQRTRLRKTDGGQYVAEVIDENGVARISPKPGSQDPMTIGELITEMKGSDTFARAFDSSGASGTGASSKTTTSAAARSTQGARTIAWNDQKALNQSLEDIANGKVVVTAG